MPRTWREFSNYFYEKISGTKLLVPELWVITYRSGNVRAPSRPGYTYIICTIIMAIIEAGISNYFNEKNSGTSIMVTRICFITYDYVCVARP